MQVLAKSQNTTLSGTITSALEQYLLEQNKKNKVAKILKLQKQIQKSENWSAQGEIQAITKSRNNKEL